MQEEDGSCARAVPRPSPIPAGLGRDVTVDREDHAGGRRDLPGKRAPRARPHPQRSAAAAATGGEAGSPSQSQLPRSPEGRGALRSASDAEGILPRPGRGNPADDRVGRQHSTVPANNEMRQCESPGRRVAAALRHSRHAPIWYTIRPNPRGRKFNATLDNRSTAA